ncbi:MAG: glycosyltransferase family 87 protein [Pseudomonadota bacterium]
MAEPKDPAVSQRLAVFNTKRGWQFALLGAIVTVMYFLLVVVVSTFELAQTDRIVVQVDFYVFWATAKLALAGTPLDAFDMERLREVAKVVEGDWMVWLYPPGFMAFLTPFGLLNFSFAWGVFGALSLIALISAARTFSEGTIPLLVATTLAPVLIPTLIVGQMSIFWSAGLVAGLAALYTGRPILAGVFIGLLTIKPQLGLMIPFALLAIGAWRTILSASVTAVIILAVPLAYYGLEYLDEMLSIMSELTHAVRGSIDQAHLIVSAYSALAIIGVPEDIALVAQWCLTALCALLVFLVWKADKTSFDQRASVLLLAIPLASPYLWYYEAAILAPAALFMWRAGVLSLRPTRAAIGLAMWIGICPIILAVFATDYPGQITRFVFLAIVVTAFFTTLYDIVKTPRQNSQLANS